MDGNSPMSSNLSESVSGAEFGDDFVDARSVGSAASTACTNTVDILIPIQMTRLDIEEVRQSTMVAVHHHLVYRGSNRHQGIQLRDMLARIFTTEALADVAFLYDEFEVCRTIIYTVDQLQELRTQINNLVTNFGVQWHVIGTEARVFLGTGISVGESGNKIAINFRNALSGETPGIFAELGVDTTRAVNLVMFRTADYEPSVMTEFDQIFALPEMLNAVNDALR